MIRTGWVIANSLASFTQLGCGVVGWLVAALVGRLGGDVTPKREHGKLDCRTDATKGG